MVSVQGYKTRLKSSVSYLIDILEDLRYDTELFLENGSMLRGRYKFQQYLFEDKNKVLWLGDKILDEVPKDVFKVLLFKTYVGLCKKIDYYRFDIFDLETNNDEKYEEVKSLDIEFNEIMKEIITTILDIMDDKLYDMKIIDKKLNQILQKLSLLIT